MQKGSTPFAFHSGVAASLGSRTKQEDFVEIWCPGETGSKGSRALLVVLCDGMGGHVSGEVASRTAARKFIEVFAAGYGTSPAGELLGRALEAGNEAIAAAIKEKPGLQGMGSTLVACFVDHEGLRWASVGDSPLFLLRSAAGSTLERLNESHSLGSLLDRQADADIISREDALNSPLRHTLRSALLGLPIPLRDVVTEPMVLHEGDCLLVASDGVESLTNSEIGDVVSTAQGDARPEAIAKSLIDRVVAKNVAHQDNTTVALIRVTAADAVKFSSGKPAPAGASRSGGTKFATYVALLLLIAGLALVGFHYLERRPESAQGSHEGNGSAVKNR